MTTPSRLSPTRRRFLQTTAAAAASGLVIHHASSAFGLAKGGASICALVLSGKKGGWVHSVEPPTYQLRDGKYGFGLFKASHTLAEAGPIAEWMLALPRKQIVAQSGSVLVATRSRVVTRRIDWTEGLVTSIAFRKLSADGKKPLMVDFEWEVTTLDFKEGAALAKAAGKKPSALPPAPSETTPATSQFSVRGVPGAEWITDIELPTAKMVRGTYGSKRVLPVSAAVDYGDLKVTFAAAARGTLSKHVKKMTADGLLGADELFDCEIDVLDSTLGKAVATIQLFGCGLRSYADGKLEANDEAGPKPVMTFSVERFDVKFAAG